MNLYIIKSKRKNKKYDLLDSNQKYILSFGDNRYSDFTLHHDEKRKTNYLLRHAKTITNKILTASFMSANVLWNKTSLSLSINDVNKRFNVNIKLIH